MIFVNSESEKGAKFTGMYVKKMLLRCICGITILSLYQPSTLLNDNR